MQTATLFNHETIVLDGDTFRDCEFKDCRLVYAGGELARFDNCKFDGCEWKFDAAASRTLAHLKLIWGLGGKAPVQALIKDITGGGR